MENVQEIVLVLRFVRFQFQNVVSDISNLR